MDGFLFCIDFTNGEISYKDKKVQRIGHASKGEILPAVYLIPQSRIQFKNLIITPSDPFLFFSTYFEYKHVKKIETEEGYNITPILTSYSLINIFF